MSNGSKRHVQYRYVVNNRERDLLWSPSVLTFLTVGVVAVVLGLQGVAEAQPDPAAYFPLTVGNRWVYEASEGTSTEEWEVIREEEDAFVIQITADSLSTASFEEEFRPTPGGIERLTRSDINVSRLSTGNFNPSHKPSRKETPDRPLSSKDPCGLGRCGRTATAGMRLPLWAKP